MILIEIQDTLKQPPSEEKSMQKATKVSIIITVSMLLFRSAVFNVAGLA